MPVGIPPLGGPLGRSRSRISASGLTTFLRCKRQWFLGSKVGISGPMRPSQVIGIVLEDAFCGLMMHRPEEHIATSMNLSHGFLLWSQKQRMMLFRQVRYFE